MATRRIRRRSISPTATALERLVDNAFDFLAGSLQLLKKDPKRSVIDFYTAVELFVKARLLCEHWTLIVTKEPDRAQFLSGDFVSVTFDEACKRLKKVIQQPISDEATAAFNVVRQHRNRMVHFFHSSDADDTRASIALEQLQAWCHLNRLLTGEWAMVLPANVPQRAGLIERSLVDQREYAQELFNQLKPTLDMAERSGVVFITCPSCSLRAAELSEERSWLRNYSCRVCEGGWSEMDMACPECSTAGVLTAYESFTCSDPACGHTVGVDDLFDAIDQNPSTHDNYLDAVTPANCDECQSHQSVCTYGAEYLCVNCLNVFDNVYACEWCGECGTEYREHSGWSGCEHCDGKVGHIKDE